MAGRGDHLVEHPVGTDADLELVLERLEMDVAGLVLDRQQQDHVDQLADRCGVDQFFLGADVVLAGEDIEVIVALVQLYREQGHYLERMYKWLKRVGMDSIKAAIVDDLDKRRHYFDRFAYSQTFYRKDPWAERAEPAQARRFAPLADLTLEAAE